MEDGPTVPYRKELSFVETCSPLRKEEKSKSTLLGGSTSHKAMSNVEKKNVLCSFAEHLGNFNCLKPLLPVVVKLGNVTRGLLKRHMSNDLRMSSFHTEMNLRNVTIRNLFGNFDFFSLVLYVCNLIMFCL